MFGYTNRTDDFWSHLATAGWVPWFYLFKAVWPLHLIAVYPKWNINASRFVSYLPGIMIVGCLALFWWKRQQSWGRALLFAAGYFLAMLFPVMGFLDQSFFEASLVADPWQYFAIVGAIALIAAAATGFVQHLGQPSSYIGFSLAALVIISLGSATWVRSGVYATERALWQDTVDKNPEAWLAHNNLGNELFRAGEMDPAIREYEEALRVKPNYTEAHKNLGVLLSQLGRTQEAIGHYEEALRAIRVAPRKYSEIGMEPDIAVIHNNLATLLLKTGRLDDSVRHYQDALRIAPDFPEAHYNFGVALAQTGDLKGEMREYEEVLRLDPDHAGAHLNLGAALAETGQFDKAISQFAEAARLKPDSVEAHNNLGVVLLQLGRAPEAIEHFQQALRINPDFAEARQNLQRARMAQ
jgi:tetratricopeptide (TPR) repeat protein